MASEGLIPTSLDLRAHVSISDITIMICFSDSGRLISSTLNTPTGDFVKYTCGQTIRMTTTRIGRSVGKPQVDTLSVVHPGDITVHLCGRVYCALLITASYTSHLRSAASEYH